MCGLPANRFHPHAADDVPAQFAALRLRHEIAADYTQGPVAGPRDRTSIKPSADE
jgi:hypothetical protein